MCSQTRQDTHTSQCAPADREAPASATSGISGGNGGGLRPVAPRRCPSLGTRLCWISTLPDEHSPHTQILAVQRPPAYAVVKWSWWEQPRICAQLSRARLAVKHSGRRRPQRPRTKFPAPRNAMVRRERVCEETHVPWLGALARSLLWSQHHPGSHLALGRRLDGAVLTRCDPNVHFAALPTQARSAILNSGMRHKSRIPRVRNGWHRG